MTEMKKEHKMAFGFMIVIIILGIGLVILGSMVLQNIIDEKIIDAKQEGYIIGSNETRIMIYNSIISELNSKGYFSIDYPINQTHILPLKLYPDLKGDQQ